MKFRLVTTPRGRRLSRLSGVLAIGMLVALGLALGWRLSHSLLDDIGSSHWVQLLDGARVTVLLAGSTTGLGFILAIGLAALRLEGPAPLAWASAGLGLILRGSPLLAQLYLVYYGSGDLSGWLRSVGAWWFFREPLNCVVLVFALNTACYQAEILQGAVRSLPREQGEAGRALGLTTWQTYRKILLPQAIRIALRPLGNEWCSMLKASALASIVTVMELLGTARFLFSENFNFDFFILAGCLYVVIVEGLRRVVNAIDNRLHAGTPAAR